MKTIIINSMIVLMLFSLSTETAMTNESGRNKRQARELRILLKDSYEKPLVLENWMRNAGYFTMFLFRETRENKVSLSRWMYDPLYFHPAFYNMVHENILRIESWMADGEYFYHIVPDIGDESINIEEWMFDSNYFKINFLI